MQFLLIINSLIDGIAIGMIGCGIIILLLVLALTVVNLRLE